MSQSCTIQPVLLYNYTKLWLNERTMYVWMQQPASRKLILLLLLPDMLFIFSAAILRLNPWVWRWLPCQWTTVSLLLPFLAHSNNNMTWNHDNLTYPLAGITQFADGAQVVDAVVLHQVYQRAEVVAVLHMEIILSCLEDFKMPHSIAWLHCRKINTCIHT